MIEKVPDVYILAYRRHGTLYIGVTSYLCSRVRQHKLGEVLAKAGDGKYVERPANAPVHQANKIWKGLTAPQGVKRIDVVP